MKKLFYLKINKFDKEIITTAIESGVDAILAPDEIKDKIKQLAIIKVISKNGDLKIGKDIEIKKITKKADEDAIVKLGGKIPVIIENLDWTIIPLENLLSKTTNIIQSVNNSKEADLALETMEKGASGICLETTDLNEIKKTAKIIGKNSSVKMSLQEAEIIETKQTTLASRCCIDTASMLNPGEGLLVGDGSSGMFLVYNENVESPYCDTRPFRVNAGGVHAYVMCPGNKTKYLGEVKSGDEVLVVNPKGETSVAVVGRNKIEKRPMMLVRAKVGDKEFSLIMQNAETIRLTDIKGNPISVTKLKPGDKVLAHVENQARHFGVKIEETIEEQ
ncbi:MAG: 3-dehydroquinate synthase II [Candidatus Gracilibacteria bacterium]|nr:3-dehydroquinate synthase II [Candidatus Gracilibacteria bacterium]